MTIRIALYQPDIPQNTGTILRTAACFGISVDIIEPAGFELSDKALRRAGLDYLKHASLTRHHDWDAYLSWTNEADRRIVLFTSKATKTHTEFDFSESDILLMGRESAGVPETVHDAVDERIKIPIRDGMRSLNLAVACAIATGEALRQTTNFAMPNE